MNRESSQLYNMIILINLVYPQFIAAQNNFFSAYIRENPSIKKGLYVHSDIANIFVEGYKNYREIIIEGRGVNEKEASLNASTKALQQIAGLFMDVRETEQLDTTIRNGKIEENNDYFGFTQSFYSDGSIRSFEKLATRRQNGITIVIAKVSVWRDLQTVSNDHPFLTSNLSGRPQNNISVSRVRARGIGRTHQLALINAMEEAISSVSLNFNTVESLETYDKVRHVIGKYVNSIEVDTYTQAKTNSAKAVQGIIQSIDISNEAKNGSLFIIDIIANVRANKLGAYLSNVN